MDCKFTIASIVSLLLAASCAAQTCGERKVANLLILGGEDAREGDWPWHAILFHKNSLSLEYKCGGTILDESTVLTAAHCLVTSAGKIARERLFVQVGRNRLLVSNNRAQEYDALELILHPEYSIHTIRNDIALVKLANEITYTDFIQPICLWNRDDDHSAIVHKVGTVVGFGYNGMYVNSLKEAHIPVVSTIECIEDNTAYAVKLTSRMFCAGKRNGVGPCNGDSGGGMFFNYSDIWYIRGIVSFAKPVVNGEVNVCDPKEYTIFTDVAKYTTWIRQYLRPAKGLNGDDKKLTVRSKSTCGTKLCTSEDAHCWPWNANLFKKNQENWKFFCGGTILNEKTILTVAHCLENFPNQPDRIVVLVGRQLLKKIDYSVPLHNVQEIILHPNYNNFRHDHNIGLIRLTTALTYTDHIQPICLWNRDKDLKPIVYTIGTLILKDVNLETGTVIGLREKRIPVISSADCEKNYNSSYVIDSTKFCAGNLGDKYPSENDGGAGLYFNYDGIWYIRGIVANRAGDAEYNIDINSYTVFTDVAQYVDWIEQNMRF